MSIDYLARWAAAVARQDFRAEHFARHVCAHLLDAGFSSQHLRVVIAGKNDAPEPVTLAELCEGASGHCTDEGVARFRGVAGFQNRTAGAKWTSQRMADWCRDHRMVVGKRFRYNRGAGGCGNGDDRARAG